MTKDTEVKRESLTLRPAAHRSACTLSLSKVAEREARALPAARGSTQAVQGWETRGGQRDGDPGRVGGCLGHVYTLAQTEEKNPHSNRWRHRHTRTVCSRRAAPGARQGAPVSTKVPSEALREASQVKHSSAEVQMEVKERH